MKLTELTSETWEFIIDHTEKLPQGILIWYQGVPYPRRAYYDRINDVNYGLRALNALGVVKKFLLSYGYMPVLPRTFSLKKWEQFILLISNLCSWQLDGFLIQDDEWSVPVWEIGKGVRLFFEGLGFTPDLSTRLSKIVMCGFEFDNAYRYPTQDVLGEANKEQLLQNPRTEIKRLYAILVSRDVKVHGKEWNIYERIGKVLTPLLWLLFLPKVNQAFKKAVEGIDFDKIKFDDNDRFHFSFWQGYNYEGKTFEERFNPYEELYKTIPFRKKIDPIVTANFMTGN